MGYFNRDLRIMSRRVAIISNIPPSFSSILGANYYDDWNFDNAASLSLTGSLIDSITSTGSNGGVFSASGTARPTLVSNDINGKDAAQFDGVTDVMSVSASNSMYNFLHNGDGGFVICVYKVALANPNTAYAIISNNRAGTLFRGIHLSYDDRSSLSRSNQNRVQVTNGTALVVSSGDTNNVITPQEYNSVVNILDADNATLNQRATLISNGLNTVNDNASTGTATASDATDNLTFGRTSSSTTFYMNGSIARLIIANTIPTATQLTQIQRRLEYEYGIFPI